MRARQIGVRQLARKVGISPGHLSRVLREVGGRHATNELIERVRMALDLPEDYFVESRRCRVVATLEERPELIDQIEEIIDSPADVAS